MTVKRGWRTPLNLHSHFNRNFRAPLLVIPAKQEAREPESMVPPTGSRVSGASFHAAPRPG
jgi:hypothetical protein